jgi:hypothetical protein
MHEVHQGFSQNIYQWEDGDTQDIQDKLGDVALGPDFRLSVLSRIHCLHDK